VGALHFEKPDAARFPAAVVGFEAARLGGTAPAALNAANEVTVQAFLDGRLCFTDITTIAAEVMSTHHFVESPTLDDILQTDGDARAAAGQLAKRKRP